MEEKSHNKRAKKRAKSAVSKNDPSIGSTSKAQKLTPTTDTAKPDNEIDDIFAAAKPAPATTDIEKNRPRKVAQRVRNDTAGDDFFDSRGLKAQARKKIDGVNVYSLDELKVGKGGGTPLCPFDCDCCY